MNEPFVVTGLIDAGMGTRGYHKRYETLIEAMEAAVKAQDEGVMFCEVLVSLLKSER